MKLTGFTSRNYHPGIKIMPSAKVFFDPFAWVWFALMAGAIWNLRQRQFRPALLLVGLAGLMSLNEFFKIPNRLMALKEQAYWQAAESPNYKASFAGTQAVVMCGGTLGISRHDFTGANYNGGVNRFLKAVELARAFNKPLVLGGGLAGGKGSPLESAYEKAWLQSWGLTNLTILTLGFCQTTHDEALAAANVAKQNGWNKIILVTSAYHMDRALGVFRKTGLNVVPVGCEYCGEETLAEKHPNGYLPTTSSAEHLRLYLCEVFGWWFYRLRSWL